MYSIKNQKSLP